MATARELLEELAAGDASSLEVRDRLAQALAAEGSDAWQNGRAAEGVEKLERASALMAAIAGADAENRQAARRLTATRSELALAMIAARRYEEAFAAHGDALDALRRAAERPGAPAFLIYERAFLASQIGKAAGIATESAVDGSERELWRRRARESYVEALRLHRDGEQAGVPSHLEPEAWEAVRRAALELGVD